MRGTTRRDFLLSSAVAGATVLLDRAPAYAQKRELTFLSFNHFVPASDDELKRQAEVFGKQAGVTVRVDTIQAPQLFAKRAAQAARLANSCGAWMVSTRTVTPACLPKTSACRFSSSSDAGTKWLNERNVSSR